MQSIDGSPGINTQVLQVFKNDPDTYSDVFLMVDAMAIRKQICYDQHQRRMTGFVDLGDHADSDVEASEALVFMVVGTKGHWKAPVAYYFTRTLTASLQLQLLKHILTALTEHGLKVWAITMDGHATNQGMCSSLGCSLHPRPGLSPKPYFEHDGAKIYVIFDPPHMLKLTRNMLQAWKVFKSSSGQIEWSYISELYKAQADAGLRLGNRLSQRHIEFHRQKMKVSLAAQTLSSSVANALETMRTAAHPQFLGCSATIEFIKIIDRLFDHLNSRNPRMKGFKAPISAFNWSSIRAFLESTRLYLLSLHTTEGQLLYNSKRHTCITGFVITIDSLLMMVPELLQKQRYILTYKFSQDHLELFFNAIRRGGNSWNNNPSTVHFQSIYKKLLVRCGVKPSTTGNVVPLEDTSLVVADSCDVSDDPFKTNSTLLLDHDYTQLAGSSQQMVVENSVIYISGWVVRKLLPKLSCDFCKSVLVSSATTTRKAGYMLLELKNNGGLVVPSNGTTKVLLSTERAIRRLMNIYSAKNICSLQQVLYLVKLELGSNDVFDMKEHIIETQYGIDNHYYSLVSLLVEKYYTLRQHHIAKVYTLRQQGLSIRHTSMKTVLFRGQ